MYLYNLPEKRYDRAKTFTGKFRIYYDNLNTNKNYLELVDNIKKVAQRNNGIDIKSYSDVKRLSS